MPKPVPEQPDPKRMIRVTIPRGANTAQIAALMNKIAEAATIMKVAEKIEEADAEEKAKRDAEAEP